MLWTKIFILVFLAIMADAQIRRPPPRRPLPSRITAPPLRHNTLTTHNVVEYEPITDPPPPAPERTIANDGTNINNSVKITDAGNQPYIAQPLPRPRPKPRRPPLRRGRPNHRRPMVTERSKGGLPSQSISIPINDGRIEQNYEDDSARSKSDFSTLPPTYYYDHISETTSQNPDLKEKASNPPEKPHEPLSSEEHGIDPEFPTHYTINVPTLPSSENNVSDEFNASLPNDFSTLPPTYDHISETTSQNPDLKENASKPPEKPHEPTSSEEHGIDPEFPTHYTIYVPTLPSSENNVSDEFNTVLPNDFSTLPPTYDHISETTSQNPDLEEKASNPPEEPHEPLSSEEHGIDPELPTHYTIYVPTLTPSENNVSDEVNPFLPSENPNEFSTLSPTNDLLSNEINHIPLNNPEIISTLPTTLDDVPKPTVSNPGSFEIPYTTPDYPIWSDLIGSRPELTTFQPLTTFPDFVRPLPPLRTVPTSHPLRPTSRPKPTRRTFRPTFRPVPTHRTPRPIPTNGPLFKPISVVTVNNLRTTPNYATIHTNDLQPNQPTELYPGTDYGISDPNTLPPYEPTEYTSITTITNLPQTPSYATPDPNTLPPYETTESTPMSTITDLPQTPSYATLDPNTLPPYETTASTPNLTPTSYDGSLDSHKYTTIPNMPPTIPNSFETTHRPSPIPFKPDKEYVCEEEYAYYPIDNECDTYIECQEYIPSKHICPDGLFYNRNTYWPNYPCVYPLQVDCRKKSTIMKPNPSGECPRRNGIFPSNSDDCGQYIVCDNGQAIIMNCPVGLSFNSEHNACDWPENVPSCKPTVFLDFNCPMDDYGRLSDYIYTYRYKDSCKEYIACLRGEPRLLRCDAGLSFDEYSGRCIDTNAVIDCREMFT